MIVTKLRIGDANTMMAEGGIQAADKPGDSPAQHYLDVMGGGHYCNRPELVKKLVNDGPEAIQWLNRLGVEFDKAEDGTMITTHGGGTSRKRMHAAADYSGAEIMRTLRDEVLNRGIPVIDFTAAIELILDEGGRAAGAVLMNMETRELLVARAKTVVIATGGAGRMHYQGFPTSNHYGATADGLVLAYRAGARLMYPETLQYHPTGAAFPAQIYGALVTEKVRSLGAMLINARGEAFMNPLETRDVTAASIIRECLERGNGVKTPEGYAVWLDTPMIERKHGEGTIEKRIPAMMRMFGKHGIVIRKEPILVYPTLHYQNGGVKITEDGMTDIENLFAAGEVVGGIHGKNRLMGNSLLDIIVFGRNAGQQAAKKAKGVTVGKLSLEVMNKNQEMLFHAAQVLKTTPGDLAAKVEQQVAETKELRHALDKIKAEASLGEARQFLMSAKEVKGLKVLTVNKNDLDANALRRMGDFLRDKEPGVVAVLSSVNGEKVTFLAVCGKEAVARGLKAGDLVKLVAGICGGKGGGKPDSAMGGGTDVLKVDDALAAVDDFVAEKAQ